MEIREKQRLFKTSYLERPPRVRVTLYPDFKVEDWKNFEIFYRESIHEGTIVWEVDIHQLLTINSLMLGLLIGLNTILIGRGGSLTLIVQTDSKLAQLLYSARIDRIIEIQKI